MWVSELSRRRLSIPWVQLPGCHQHLLARWVQHQPRTSLVAGAVAVHGAGRKISRKVSLQKEAKKIKIESTQGNEAACDGYQEAR